MKYKLLFLTPFTTSNTEGKMFRNLLALFLMFMGMGLSWGQSTCLSQLNFTTTPTSWAATSITYASNEAIFSSNNGELTTLALSNPTSLVFDLRRTNNSTVKTLFVEVSTTTQGGVYTTVETYTHSNTTSNATTNITLDLSAYSSNNTVFIKFRKSSSTTSPWYLKNVVVNCSSYTPTINLSTASLTNFSQTSSTPSAEQTYTVSGNNLTNNVTITSPTGFEISTTTGSGFANSIVLSQSGGVLSGQPVTIYVRQNSSTLGAVTGNIVHTSTDATNVNIALSGSRTGTYYSKSTGNIDDLANWGLNTDGTGTSPSNFTSDGAFMKLETELLPQ